MNARAAGPVQILLVEDNPHDVLLTRETLRETKLNNNLSVAEDGEQALAFLRRSGIHALAPRPDLILMDLNLPNIDGRELLSIIKQDDALKTIPVVILTTSEAEEDIYQSYKLHANCYITKPVNLDEFSRVVRAVESFWFAVVKLPRESA
ncbi:response regulator [soil metagenome]